MATEIEARYVVPDRALFDKLLKLEHLNEYALKPSGSAKIVDHYLDTKGHALLRQGWACRLRAQAGSWLLTLKGPKDVQGAILTRPEFEIPLPEHAEDIAQWPKGPLRDLVRELTGGAGLRHLLSIRQMRHRFALVEGPRQVAELSLDVVSVASDGLHQRTYMLECELRAGGEVADLERVHVILLDTYFLVPETRSKLQRALEFVELGAEPEEALARQFPPLPLEALCDRYDIDLERANYVADLADALWERWLPLHQLPEARRPLLRTAALLHNIGETTDHALRHIMGRDILLRQPITGLDAEAQRMLAAMVFLQRRKVTPERLELAFPQPLAPEVRHEALVLAAILRLAVALDSSATQSTHIEAPQPDDPPLRIALSGPHAAADAARAADRADLWQTLWGNAPEWCVATERPAEETRVGEASAPAEPSALPSVGLLPTDSMRIAARKVLQFQFERLLQHEVGTRQGRDPESLHDMRVTTRRLRSALGLFRPYLAEGGHPSGTQVVATADRLRRLARVLGEVRDLDVAIIKARGYVDSVNGGHPPSAEAPRNIEALFAEWQSHRQRARRRLLAYLNSRSYRVLVEGLRALLDELAVPQAAIPKNHILQEMAPRLLYIRWQGVRAYAPVLKGAPREMLHTLRIDCKHLRYALEFFVEVLSPSVNAVVRDVVVLQDHLGDWHDAVIALQGLDEFTARSAARTDAASLAGIAAYRQARQEEMERLLKAFPDAWRRTLRRLDQRLSGGLKVR
jgi:CHAD domain-containing protein